MAIVLHTFLSLREFAPIDGYGSTVAGGWGVALFTPDPQLHSSHGGLEEGREREMVRMCTLASYTIRI